MQSGMNRLFFRLLLILSLAAPVVISASWFIWLDAPARNNPHDPKSPLYIPPTPIGVLPSWTPSNSPVPAVPTNSYTMTPTMTVTRTFTLTQTPGGPSNTPTSSASFSPTVAASRTFSPTSTPGGACYAPDQLDLLTTNGTGGPNPCVANSLQPSFEIVNHSAVAVQITTLQIRGWFNQYAVAGTGWGGDTWRTHVYDNTGTQVDAGGIAATETMASGTYGSMATQVTFAFTTSQTIPAGGYVIAGGAGPLFPINTTDPSGKFDASCNNYSGVGGASPYNSALYYEDSHWQLIEGGQPVCEYASTNVIDPNSGIPAGGSTCSCPTGTVATATPSPTKTNTPSPTPTAGGACYAPDQLDLEVSDGPAGPNPCTGNSEQPSFKIINNSAVAVQVTNLQIRGWFNQYAIVGTGWGGDTWRTHVYDNTGTQVDASGIAATGAAASGTYGSMATQITFTFTTSQTIPAGGWVIAGGAGPFFPLDTTDPSGLFDTACNNYSGVGGATPYVSGTWYEDSHWQLLESGAQVCEYTAPGVKDPNTGVPAGGSTCTCP